MEHRIIVLFILLSIPIRLAHSQEDTYNINELLQAETKSSDQVFESYLDIKRSIRTDHQKFITDFDLATTESEKRTVAAEAKKYLIERLLIDIVPAWKGTLWTFNGYTNFPQKGSIACGWFVQRVLEHLDFTFIKKQSRRPYFAQNWPKTMIEGLAPRNWTFPNSLETLQTINDHITTLEEDLYLIGFATSNLDPGGHVGILLTSSDGPYIIHSLGKVECTRANENYYYYSSDFFYLGKVFNNSVINCWLVGKPIAW